jgi:hypothetical protein
MGPGGDRQIAVALAAASDMLWDAQGLIDESARLYRGVELWVDESTPPRLAARFWFAVADLSRSIDLKRQVEAGLKAAELFRSLGDRFWVFRSLATTVTSFAWLADRVAMESALTEMEALLDPAWPPWAQTAIAYGRALREFFIERRPEEARKIAGAAVESHRRGDSLFRDMCEFLLPPIDFAAGDFESGLHRCDDLLGGSGIRIEDAHLRAFVLVWRGVALLGLGNLEAAESALRLAAPIYTRAVGPAIWVFCSVASLLARQGRLVEAAKTIAYIDRRLQEPDRECLPPESVHRYEEVRAIVERGFDTEALERLRSDGSRLSAEEVIAIAFPGRT